MNVVITGFMGTGKSTVGRKVAEALGAVFIDLDTVIEKNAGQPVKILFSSRGEAAFRKMESEAVAEAVKADRTVIATGGGTLLDPASRERLQRNNNILVCLTATVGTLLERIKNDADRPLLQGEALPDRLKRIMKERESIYGSCPVQISTDGRSVDEIAGEIIQHVGKRWRDGV
jgi:shikimate kinase